MKICIDPGHGGRDLGAIGTDPFRLEEKEFNLSLSLLLEEEFERRGHWTVMTRRRDRSLSLQARANFANRLRSEFFISIHANGAETPVPEGMEVYHYPGSAAGANAAKNVLEGMITVFPEHKNRGVKEANFAVLRLTDMPAVLVESEFITNPTQLRFLADQESQRNLAFGIANGIDAITKERYVRAARA
jgi:N-acetylmuramoyl-L-alanine amidase